MGDTVIFESIKVPGMFMRSNTDTVKPGLSRELNIATAPTRFKIVPVAKHRDTVDTNFIRGGHFLQLYQRQTQRYLYRDRNGDPCLLRPKSEELGSSESLGNTAFVPDRPSLRADITWQLEQPAMKWSGAKLERLMGDEKQYFSLKDAISGKFLVEREGGQYVFGDKDDLPDAHWNLVPIDEDTVNISFEHTAFWIQNKQSGNMIDYRTAADRGASDRAETDELETATDGGTPEDLVVLYGSQQERVDETDLFICRPLPDDTLGLFRKLQHQMPTLNMFHREVKRCAGGGKESITDRKSVV